MAGGSFVGLDIGSNLIKVVEMRGGGGRVEVTALGMAPTPPEAFDNGVIVDSHALGAAVKALLKQAGVSSNQSVSAASSSSAVVVRVIDVPQMNPAELAETMKWETERQVPFSMSDIIMDYKVVERPEGYAEGQNMDVVLAVAQQEFIDRHVETLFAAGLKPKYIDVVPLATGRALLDMGANGAQPSGHTVCVVNIGASVTDIAIFRDRLLAFPRTLPLAGDNLTRAIADALQVDLARAEEYKRDQAEVMFDQMPQQAAPTFGGDAGFVTFDQSSGGTPVPQPTSGPTSSPSGRMPFDFSGTPDQPAATPFDINEAGSAAAPSPAPETAPAPLDLNAQPAPAGNLPVPTASSGTPDALKVQVFNAIAPLLAELVQELRRSLEYYRSRAGDAPVHEILLVGGTAKLKNLAPFIESELGIQTRIANPLQSVHVASKNFSRDYLEDVSTLFPVSLGLAAYDLVAPAAPKSKKK